MTFKTLALSDLNQVLLNTTEFGESITYKTYLNENIYTSKSIKAVVFREQEIPYDIVGNRNLSKTCRIIISNDAVNGMATIKKGLDKVLLPDNIGESSVEWRVIEVIKQDFTCWELRCRK